MDEEARQKQKQKNTERQRKYRQRNMYRINMITDAKTAHGLAVLANHYAVTKRKMIETLIEKEKQRVIEKVGVDGLWDGVGHLDDLEK